MTASILHFVITSQLLAEGKGNECIQDSTVWALPLPPTWSEGHSRHISISTVSVGSRSLSAGSTLFAGTPVASRDFVLTVRIPTNVKCFFMLRSGKFNNTLAGFMLSCENRMNMERDCDMKGHKSASPDLSAVSFWSEALCGLCSFLQGGRTVFLFVPGVIGTIISYLLWDTEVSTRIFKNNPILLCYYRRILWHNRVIYWHSAMSG